MKDIFCQNLKRLRKQKDLNQEQLAQALDVTVQAVSKWECGLSYPDIDTLLLLSDFLEVSVDELLRDSNITVPRILPELPDDNTLRIIQCVGNRMIHRAELCHPNVHNNPIPLTLKNNSENNKDNPIYIEIWGNAELDGNIFGSVNAGGSLTCEDIHGDVQVGDYINCEDIGGDAHAGDSINCGDINGDAYAGDCINCKDIDGNAHAGDCINCENIDGDAEAENYIQCNELLGDAHAEKNIECGNISGSVHVGENLTCNDIHGDICSCNGDIYCNCVNGSINFDGSIELNSSDSSLS